MTIRDEIAALPPYPPLIAFRDQCNTEANDYHRLVGAVARLALAERLLRPLVNGTHWITADDIANARAYLAKREAE